jgi:hypothetical protein
MAKILLDTCYYTDLKTAKWCIDKTLEIIGQENISEIIEPVRQAIVSLRYYR